MTTKENISSKFENAGNRELLLKIRNGKKYVMNSIEMLVRTIRKNN